jgi:ketosteroid isomerase-like protein
MSPGEQFYRAFLAADEAALADVVAPDAVLVVRGSGLLAGGHRGPAGIATLRRTIAELTADSWRPLGEDTHDVTESQWHAVVLDKFLAERNGRQLASHEAFVLAVEDGRIVRLFHYVHDPDGFASFWS